MKDVLELIDEEVKRCILTVSVILLVSVGGENIIHEETLLESVITFLGSIKNTNDRGKEHMESDIYSHQKTNLMKMQERIIPDDQEIVLNPSQITVSNDDSEDWFETPIKKPQSISKAAINILERYNTTKEMSIELTNINFESNINFIENISTTYGDIERKSPHFPSKIYEVLFDEDEHTSQLVCPKVTGPLKKDQFSEDSGICSNNGLEDSSADLKTLPAEVVNDIGRSKTTNPDILESFENILTTIKTEIDSNTQEVVQNWKESLVEHCCSIVNRCSRMGADYEIAVQDFIEDMLFEIWQNDQMNQNAKWSQQISITKKLLTTPSICLEVLFFITDVLDNVTTATNKGCCTPLMTVKVALFLELYPTMARTLDTALKPIDGKPFHNSINVTKLWQKRFSSFTSDDYHRDVIQVIKTDIIPKLTAFVTSTMNKVPLISLAAKEALDEFNNISSEPHVSPDSQDSLKDLY